MRHWGHADAHQASAAPPRSGCRSSAYHRPRIGPGARVDHGAERIGQEVEQRRVGVAEADARHGELDVHALEGRVHDLGAQRLRARLTRSLPARLAGREMREAGFDKPHYHNLTGGIVALHKGYKV